MKKKIWVMNHYASSMLFNNGGRHYWFAKYLRRDGYEPVVFSCNAKHGIKERWVDSEDLWFEKKAEDINTPFVLVKAPLYNTNGKDRIINMIAFYFNVQKAAKEYAVIHGKPDIIYASSVHPLTLVAGIKLAKCFGVKCISEARDLWPEAIVAYSKRITRNSILARIMYAGEKWIYKKSDALIFTQEGGPDYIRDNKWDLDHGGPIDLNKAFHINNGVDLEAFDKNLEEYCFDDPDLDTPDTFKAIYAGSIRRINNLGIIIDAAKLIKNPQIRFIVFGDGDELEMLKDRIKKENIDNVLFKGRIDKCYIPSVDKKADINIVHWEMNPLVRVGESYNKAFEYFAAGKPVFYTIRPGYSIVERYHCGRLTDGFTPKDIANGIEAMAKLSVAEKTEMGNNARYVAKIYDFKILTKKLEEIIESI